MIVAAAPQTVKQSGFIPASFMVNFHKDKKGLSGRQIVYNTAARNREAGRTMAAGPPRVMISVSVDRGGVASNNAQNVFHVVVHILDGLDIAILGGRLNAGIAGGNKAKH